MTPTREQIIQWAMEAGFPFNKYGMLQGDAEGEFDADDMFVRLAALIEQAARADERERIARHYEAQPYVEHFGRELADEIRARNDQ